MSDPIQRTSKPASSRRSGSIAHWRGPGASRPGSRAPGSSTLQTAVILLATLLAAIAFGRVHQLFGFTSRIPVGKLLLPLMVVLLALTPDLLARISRLTRTPHAWALLGLIAAICLSVPLSLVPGRSFDELVFFLRTAVVIVLAIGLAVRSKSDLVTVVTGVVVSIALLGGATGKQGLMGGAGRYGASTTYDPNDVAFACVVALPLAFWLLATGRKLVYRAVGLAGIGGALLGVIFSGSRGGFVGLAAVLLAFLFARGRTVPFKWRLGFLVLVGAGLALAPGSFWTRVSSLSDLSGDYNLRAETGRKKVWLRGIRYTMQRPFWGVGFGQFNAAEGKLSGVDTRGRGWKWSTAHNSPILVAAELGLLGLLAWLGLYAPTWWITRRYERDARRARDPTLVAWGKAFRVALIGFFVSGFFLSQAFGGVAMTLAGLGIATAVLIHPSSGGVRSSPTRPTRRQRRPPPDPRRAGARLARAPTPAPRWLLGPAKDQPDESDTPTR